MSESAAFRPIALSERIVLLDVLRGFALAGILLMNIEAFVGPLNAALTGLDPHWHGADRLADGLTYVFVQGKFYTLFSLLFGMGFAVMAQRAQQAGHAFFGVYLRRSLCLLLIGLLHALLLWSGDVLVSYALLSVLLLMTRQVPREALPWIAVCIYLSSALLVLFYAVMGVLAQSDPATVAQWHAVLAEAGNRAVRTLQAQRDAYGGGNYLQATLQRWQDLKDSLGGLSINGPTMFGMFLLGSWFVRSGAIIAPAHWPRLYAILRWGLLPLGLVAMVASVALQPWIDPARLDLRLALAAALASLAGGLMSLGYLGWVVRFAGRLGWLAPAGRMALSNYLLQSLLCTSVFYGYGLGYFEHLPRAWQVPFALVLFALQVLLSWLWLRYFRFGPLEWLWRSATYLQVPPLRLPRKYQGASSKRCADHAKRCD